MTRTSTDDTEAYILRESLLGQCSDMLDIVERNEAFILSFTDVQG